MHLNPGFTGSTLDRADHLRTDEPALAALRADPRARILCLDGLDPVAGEREGLCWRERATVIATRLREGRTLLRVLADTAPGDGFEPVPASLEDVYFATLAAVRSPQPAAAH